MQHDIPIYEYEFLVSNSYQSLGFGQESVWGRISYVTLQVRNQADSGPVIMARVVDSNTRSDEPSLFQTTNV